MRQKVILIVIAFLYSIAIVVFPVQVGEGVLLPFISLLVAILLARIATFQHFKSQQIFFISMFGYLILVSHFYGITLHAGALLSTNFSYFLRLSILPILVEIIIGIFVFRAAIKWKESTKSGLSIVLIGYFSLVSFMMFFSVLLYGLLNHSV